MGVTQSEIARITGVSRSTVATILSGKFAANYSAETREEVIETARRLNYRPNRQAHTLKTGRSGVIGIVHTGSILPLTHARIAAAVGVIREAKLEPLVYHNIWFEDSKGITDNLLEHRVQGVILINNCYEPDSPDLDRLLKAAPVVQFGGLKCPGVPLVSVDKAGAVVAFVEHLAEMGHRRIFMMSSGAQDSPILNPISAFTEAFHKPRLRHIEHQIFTVRGAEEDREDIYAPGSRFFDAVEPYLDTPCAVIALNDNQAVGLYLRCIEAGLRVPEDVAMTGWDNIVLGRRLPSPLTTGEHPTAEMARRCMDILLSNPRTDPDLMELFPCRRIFRASSGRGTDAPNTRVTKKTKKPPRAKNAKME